MTREQRWAWSNILHEYRMWAEWYFRESKYVFGTAPEDEHERRAKQLWTATVMNHRTKDTDYGKLSSCGHPERKSNNRKAA